VACAKEDEAFEVMGGYMNSYPIDTALALESFSPRLATEKGIGQPARIGAFKEKLVKDLLDVPDNVRVVAITPVGYPATEGGVRGSKTYF